METGAKMVLLSFVLQTEGAFLCDALGKRVHVVRNNCLPVEVEVSRRPPFTDTKAKISLI